jgi:short-subunit dehydrogenase
MPHMHPRLHAHTHTPAAACHPYQVRAIACDVGKPEEVRKLLTKLAPTPITCLVANAGGGGGRGFTPYV